MKVRIFTLRLDPATGDFDDSQLRQFQEGRDIIEVSEYQFTHERIPTWGVLVRYRELEPELESGPRRKSGFKKSKQQNKPDLDPADKALFDVLSQWRTSTAAHEGYPPYVVFSNAELEVMAVKRPETKSALSQIRGVGKIKLEKYGAQILQIIASFVNGGDATNDNPTDNQSQTNQPKSG